MKYFVLAIIALFFNVNNVWSAPTVKLLCERHRTEWNWVEYRLSLTNTSSVPIQNPEIHYYAAGLDILDTVDFSSNSFTVSSTATPVRNMTDIKFNANGVLNSDNKLKINFRIYKKDWSRHSFAKDWSYQQKANKNEPNYFMSVYDGSHNILWGSDPINGNYNTGDVVTWSDRGVNSTVYRYDGNKNESISSGRFWLFKDTPLSPKERDLLVQRGVSQLSIGRSHGKIVAAFKTASSIKKKSLDSLLAGFYNAISIADTVPLEIELLDEDLHSEKTECDAIGNCQNVIEPRSHFETHISCWNDVDLNDCITTIRSCGGDKIGVARGFIVANVVKDSLQCLSKKKDVESLNIQRKMALTNNSARESINISSLQNSEAWQKALEKDSAYLDWLKGVDYTGEGIVVGVYDEPVDFDHPDFNEYDSTGHLHPRIMRKNEFYGVNYESAIAEMNKNIKLNGKGLADRHGTGVAGNLGGNGNASKNFLYRGVAPKVHFYTGESIIYNQIGHVENHSHTIDKGWYGDSDYLIDEAIFNNWKSECSKLNTAQESSLENCVEGDSLTKTVVFGAGNNGVFPSYGKQIGYFSILANAKNPIVVGNISAKEKVRHHASSMGPTWDGRIKPDVMAPGENSYIIADSAHPFEIQIDYIKLFREGEYSPYMIINSENNILDFGPDNSYSSCDTVNSILDCKVDDNLLKKQLYVSWRLKKSTSILPNDKIQVRYKKVLGGGDSTSILGTIWLGSCKDLLDENGRCNSLSSFQTRMDVSWPLSDTFNIATFKFSDLSSKKIASFLRLDFNFIRGSVTTDICHGDICGYKALGDGGTSQSAPFVSGIAALMYQKFQKQTRDPLNKHSMRNSTVKALLIHTAVDMEDSEDAHSACNPDLDKTHNDGKCHFTPYGKGPDFATGWGYVDGEKALNLIKDYDSTTKTFPNFKEIEIGNGIEKRWVVNVDSARSSLRTTLVWDDAPPGNRSFFDWIKPSVQVAKDSKLVNDLDMYLISPSGKYYYPWRLDRLPTYSIGSYLAGSNVSSGYEYIREQDIGNANRNCLSSFDLDYECFDHLNNVEVVDVDNPELGKWQVVVFGRSITAFNNDLQNAQVASLVSDLNLRVNDKISTTNSCRVINGYAPQTDYSCTYELGNDLIYYVTFHDSTSLGEGDNIVLTDASGVIIGIYVGKELSGKTINVRSKKLTVTLHSDNDQSQGWGFGIAKIRSINRSILKMPFEAIKKKRRIP